MDDEIRGHCAPDEASETASNIANHAPKSPSTGDSQPLLGDSSKSVVHAGCEAPLGHEGWHKTLIGDVR